MQSDTEPQPASLPVEHEGGFEAVRDEAIARLGHAVRTPLSIVSASVEMLGTPAAEHAVETRTRVLDNAVDRLRRLLEHLIVVSRWPTEDAVDGISLGDAVRLAVRRTEADAADRDVEIDVTVEEQVDVVAHGEVLVWALTAMVDRAVAEVDGGGRVVLDVSRTDDDCAVVMIMPQHDDEVTHDRVPEGAPDVVGDLAAEVIARAWGEVRLRAGSHGTTATVVLPILGATRPAPSTPGQPTPVRRSRSVATERPVPDPVGPEGARMALVVEDDPTLREFLTRTLSAEWRVVPVASAERALDAARHHRPDIIVCDIMLPGIDGETLVHELQDLDPMTDVPIIVLTGRTDETLRVRLLRDGADDYLTKPFAIDELRVRMANLASEQLDLEELRRRADQAETLAEQLQHALRSRIVIEQAKAFVAAAVELDVDEAFELIRGHARNNQARIHDVARAVVDSRRWPPR